MGQEKADQKQNIRKSGAQSVHLSEDGSILSTRSKMAIDTDGSGNHHGDKTAQNATSMTYADGTYLNADKTPYVVLPPDMAKKYGVKKGDLAVVRYGDKMAPAIFGDVGPKGKLGEGSYRLAQELGINPNPNTGGADRDVEMLFFPGSGKGKKWTQENTTPQALMTEIQELLQRHSE